MSLQHQFHMGMSLQHWFHIGTSLWMFWPTWCSSFLHINFKFLNLWNNKWFMCVCVCVCVCVWPLQLPLLLVIISHILLRAIVADIHNNMESINSYYKYIYMLLLIFNTLTIHVLHITCFLNFFSRGTGCSCVRLKSLERKLQAPVDIIYIITRL